MDNELGTLVTTVAGQFYTAQRPFVGADKFSIYNPDGYFICHYMGTEITAEILMAIAQGYEAGLAEEPDDEPEELEEETAVLDISEDDYQIDHNYHVSQYGKCIYKGNSMTDALKWIYRHMDRENFWPGIYYSNDHGNVDLINMDGEIIQSWV